MLVVAISMVLADDTHKKFKTFMFSSRMVCSCDDCILIKSQGSVCRDTV